MAQLDFALTGGNVVLPDGRLEPLNVGVLDGRIASITDQALDADETLDVGGLTVAPGLIDEHFHVFWGYGWETYQGATRRHEGRHHDRGRHAAGQPGDADGAAPAGEARPRSLGELRGLRAVRRLPRRGPRRGGGPRGRRHRRAQALHRRRRASRHVPGADTGQISTRCGAPTPPGSSWSSTARTPSSSTSRRRLQAEGRSGAEAWDEARPWYSEVEAVQRVALVGRGHRLPHRDRPRHVTPVGRGGPRCAGRGADVWVETCPHYLCLTTEDMAKDGRLKWNPPSRNPARSSGSGSCSRTATCTRSAPTTRRCRSSRAPTCGRSFPAPATASSRCCPWSPPRRLGEASRSQRVVDLLSTTPARLFGLYPRKGTIAVGADADFAVLETNGRRTLDAQELEYHDQEKWSPYDGWEVTVYPVYTVLRGRVIAADGKVLGEPGGGEFVTRRRSSLWSLF